MQTASERAFDLWVKTVAIELIRQTPLEAVKYLDILTLADCWTRKRQEDCTKDWNFNYVKAAAPHPPCDFCPRARRSPPTHDASAPPPEPPPPVPAQHEEKNLEVLLKRCQNAENYVPVKEKLVLFESLCRLGRKVRSTEDVSVKVNVEATKRAASMHDLSNCAGSAGAAGVRQMCKLFESRNDERNNSQNFGGGRRLIMSDSHLHNKDVYRFGRDYRSITNV